MRRVKRLLRLTACLLALYYSAVIAVGLLAFPQQADIAVVLGNEVLKSGELADRLAARVDCALALYRQKKVRLIMVSGGMSSSGFDEATAMAKHLVKNGVPESDIIIDSAGVNTMATAENTAKLMKDKNLHSAVIVTQYFHVPRTQLAFHMAGVAHFSADYPLFFEWRDIPSTLREMVALPVYLVTKKTDSQW